MRGWSYDGKDVGILLFDACLKAGAPIRFSPGMAVLEIACCEEDWLERADQAWPETKFQGIDARADKKNRPYRMKRDVMHTPSFAPESFDALVSLSAIEHIGLGHYGDPLEPKGDMMAMVNAWQWLKPGGWFYLDVPYDPSGYRLQGTKCRIYDDEALIARLIRPADWRLVWHGYSEHADTSTLVPKPTKPIAPFHYVALVLEKRTPRKLD